MEIGKEVRRNHCKLHRTYQGGIERGEHNLTIGMVMTISKGLGMTMSERQTELKKKQSRRRVRRNPNRL